jgi:hypothetical protein
LRLRSIQFFVQVEAKAHAAFAAIDWVLRHGRTTQTPDTRSQSLCNPPCGGSHRMAPVRLRQSIRALVAVIASAIAL